jgi:hypothetical protein
MTSSTLNRRSRAVVTAMFVGIAAAGVVLAPPAAAEVHLAQYIEVPQCQPAASQDCPQIPEVKFTAGQNDRIQIQFTANANHCSDMLVRFFVDDYPQGDWLRVGPGQTVSSPTFTRSGDHVLGVRGKGIAGGCNIGVLNSWGGTVHIDSIDVVGPAPHPVPPPGPTPCKWRYSDALVIEQDNGLRVEIDDFEDLTAVGPVHLYARGATVPSDRGELIGASGEGTHVNFTVAWFDKKNNYVTTNDYVGNIDPEWGTLRGTTVNNEGVKNEWSAHEHFTCK